MRELQTVKIQTAQQIEQLIALHQQIQVQEKLYPEEATPRIQEAIRM